MGFSHAKTKQKPTSRNLLGAEQVGVMEALEEKFMWCYGRTTSYSR